MPSNFTVTIRERQNIRIRIAEFRRVPVQEVLYPVTNLTAYQYMLELGDITQDAYENLQRFQIYRQQYINIGRQNNRQQNLTLSRISLLINYMNEINMPQYIIDAVDQVLSHQVRSVVEANNQQTEHPMADANPTHERIIEHYGERLAESNNSLCQECLMPIALGEELCEECHQESPVIPNWLFN